MGGGSSGGNLINYDFVPAGLAKPTLGTNFVVGNDYIVYVYSSVGGTFNGATINKTMDTSANVRIYDITATSTTISCVNFGTIYNLNVFAEIS